MRDLRGREMSMIFQNPRAALNPIRKVGHQIEDVLLQHVQASPDAARQGDRGAGAGAHRPPGGALPRLSVRALRRHVPARRDRLALACQPRC
jgi:ABC-type dipeptide/oligopeptide/nickel transport system ATPase component